MRDLCTGGGNVCSAGISSARCESAAHPGQSAKQNCRLMYNALSCNPADERSNVFFNHNKVMI